MKLSISILGIATVWALLLAGLPTLLADTSCIASTGFVTDVSTSHFANCTKLTGNLVFEQELTDSSWAFWSTVTDITGSLFVSVWPDSWPFTSLVNVTDTFTIVVANDFMSRLADEDGWALQSVGTLNVTSTGSNFTTINITLPYCDSLIINTYSSSAEFDTLIVNSLASLYVLDLTIQPIDDLYWEMPELLMVTQFNTYNVLPSAFINIMVQNNTKAQVGSLSIKCVDALYEEEETNSTSNSTSNETTTEYLLGFNSVTWFGSVSIMGCNSSEWGDGSYGGGDIYTLETLELVMSKLSTVTPWKQLVNVTTYMHLDLDLVDSFSGVFDSLENVGTLHIIDIAASSCVFEALSFANAIAIESREGTGSMTDIHFPSLTNCSTIGLSGLSSLTNFTVNNLGSLFTDQTIFTSIGSSILTSGVMLVSKCGLYDITLPSLDIAGGINFQNNDRLNFINFPAIVTITGATGFVSQGCPLDQLLLPNIANISGALVVMNTNITELSLTSLVYFESFTLQWNAFIKTFSFARGTVIALPGSILIDNCASLVNINSLYWVTAVAGSIQITNCESLVSMLGLCGPHYVAGELIIDYVPSVCTTSLDTIMLFTVAGGYDIDTSANASCTTGFNDFYCNCASLEDELCFDFDACSNNEAEGDILCFPCPANQYMENRQCLACGTHRASPEGSVGVDSCVCAAGYFGQLNATCEACPLGTYKTRAVSSSSCTSCPAHATTLRTASTSRSECECVAGYHGTNGGTCRLCAAGSFCPGGSNVTVCPANCYCAAGSATFITCPSNSVSLAGSVSIDNCTCDPAFFLDTSNNGHVCDICPAGSFCEGGSAAITVCPVNCYCAAGSDNFTSCPMNMKSLEGSISIDNCTCLSGFSPVNDSDPSLGCERLATSSSTGTQQSSTAQQSSTSQQSSTGGQKSSSTGSGSGSTAQRSSTSQQQSTGGGQSSTGSGGGSSSTGTTTRSSTGSQQGSSSTGSASTGGGAGSSSGTQGSSTSGGGSSGGAGGSSSGSAGGSSTGGSGGGGSSSGTQQQSSTASGGGSSGGGSGSTAQAGSSTGSNGSSGSNSSGAGAQSIQPHIKRGFGRPDEKPTDTTTSAALHVSVNNMLMMLMVMVAAVMTRTVFIH